MGRNCNGTSSKAALLLLLVSGAMSAQEFPFTRFAELRQKFPPDAVGWSREQYVEYNRQFAGLLEDVVWLYRRPDKPRLRIISRLAAPRNPPNWQGDTILSPMSYAHDMIQLGFMLGRDLSVDLWGRLPEDTPLTSHAFSAGHLVRAIDASIDSVSPVFDANSERIVCKQEQTACAEAQGLAVLALPLFMVAHECGHYVLNHGGPKEDAQELAADRYAWDTLRAVAMSLHGNDEKSNRFLDSILAAAAEAPLWYELQSRTSLVAALHVPTGSVTLLKRRIDQIDKLGDALGIDIRRFMPEPYSGWAVQPVKISFERPPAILIVHGARVNLQEIADGTIRLPPAVTWILAADDKGVACEESYGDEPSITLKFRPWASATADELGQYEASRRWCDVIAATADAQLHPRSPELGPYLNEALYYTRAGTAIEPSLTTAADRESAQRDRSIASGLTGWGFSPSLK